MAVIQLTPNPTGSVSLSFALAFQLIVMFGHIPIFTVLVIFR
jgi:hypothetical protein